METKFKSFLQNVVELHLAEFAKTFSVRTRVVADRGSSVVWVLCYKSEVLWFDTSWCQWIFH